ncbi:MAG: hypothetical protein KKE69_00920 [Alphaproteobacteria bacterium]|nr:hypothetical protein [Alphaproteobacteria bacterium]MBU1606556.1 hypothetical protein [Alphaproteobacteria bacterium]
MARLGFLVLLLAIALPLAAKESLGVFDGWGAFRDEAGPRCYAIAVPRTNTGSRDAQAFASIATWPQHEIRGQVHFRLSRARRVDSAATLQIGSERFELTGGGVNAWGADRRMDAAITAALRSARQMRVTATDTRGRRFVDSYALSGVASAMDAATVGCARRG